MTDDDLLEIHNRAVDKAMHDQAERDGFGSNMSREAIVAGLRAVERAAAWKAINLVHDNSDSPDVCERIESAIELHFGFVEQSTQK
jgi:hypothetical protein